MPTEITWKDVACARLCIPVTQKDYQVLDELIRVDVDGGARLLQFRDQQFKLLKYLTNAKRLTEEDADRATDAMVKCVQVLRNYVVEIARQQAADATIREDFQPSGEYQDPAAEETLESLRAELARIQGKIRDFECKALNQKH